MIAEDHETIIAGARSEKKSAVASESKNKDQIHSTTTIGTDDFLLVDVKEDVIEPAPEYLAEIKRIGWKDFAFYPRQRAMRFGIKRQSTGESDCNNMCRYANAVRCYINARNEVLVLDFIPNHEQTTSARVVTGSGEPCLIDELRTALNGVVANQVRGAIYELHVVNNTPNQMDIMTQHITRKDAKPDDPWHADFAPTIKLGRIEPASELHISQIYMKAGRVFTNEQYVLEGSEVRMPPDHTYFLHNGFTTWEQPDMIDPATGQQLRDPMTESPFVCMLGIPAQPYMDPRDIVLRALNQLIEDLSEIDDQIAKSRATFAENPAAQYKFGNVAISMSQSPKARGMIDLISQISGFEEVIGVIIASNAYYIAPKDCLHNSSHLEHFTMKNVIIRITSSNPLDLYAQSVELAIARTKSLIAQFGAV